MYLAFDTETTGLKEHCNVLTAYFIILDENLNEIDSLDLKIKYPYYIVYSKAMEVNKIDLVEHDKIAVFTELAVLKLTAFLEKNKTEKKLTMLGHNVEFDLKMLTNNKIFTLDMFEKYISIVSFTDTLIYAKELKSKKLIPKTQSLSLSKLCYYYNLDNNDDVFHNAEFDIRITVSLYKKLKQIETDYSSN
jgi:DNA polymerase III alpha subunit (gram-positive type)